MKRKPPPDKLDPRCQQALAAAVIVGEPIELPLLQTLGIENAALDPLFDTGLLVAVDSSQAMLGPRVNRAEAETSLPWSERRHLHERIADCLMRRRDRLADAARHYVAACCFPEARRTYVRAAESRCREQQYDIALGLLDEALKIWPAEEDSADRMRVVRELARCARNCGRNEIARRVWREMLELAQVGESLPPDVEVEAHQHLADLSILALEYGPARKHLQAAAQLAEIYAEREEISQRWYALASFLADQTRPSEARIELRKATEHADSPAQRSEILGFDGLLAAMMGRADEASTLVEEALQIALQHDLSSQVAIAYRRLANIREYRSDYRGEREAHLHAIELCLERNEKETEHSCLACLAYAFFRTGEWKRSLETTRKVLDDPYAHPGLHLASRGIAAMISAFRGEVRGTREMLEEARLGLRRFGVLTLEFHLLWAIAVLQEVQGDADGAAATYAGLLDFWEETEDRHDVAPGTLFGAAFFATKGDGRRLARCANVLNTIATANDNEETRSARRAVLGEVAAFSGDLPAAIEFLTLARDGYDRLGTPVERTHVRHRLAAILQRSGNERQAADERNVAAGIAKRLGLRPLLATTPPSPKADETLTARQREMLQLLSSGLTNKEAADRLKLSPRTVEMHVARLLERLNCRTRAEAVRRAAELQLFG